MERTLKRTICITLALAALAFSHHAHASHATNFLDGLYSEVTNRLANPGTNNSPAALKALSSAARSLNRDTRTLAADLGALASAAEQLNARFAQDETFAELEAGALADYSSEAHARLDGVNLWIGTNNVSKGLSNQVAKASAALDRADATAGGVPAQARALAAAFNRILPVERKVQSLFDAPATPEIPTPPPVTPPPPPPPIVPPGTPGFAPDSIGTRNMDLKENRIVNDQTVFYFSTAPTGAQVYNVHQPEELGLWQYVRTGADSAVVAVTPNYPQNAGTRLLNLTFTSATSGTFTATTFDGEVIEGVIVLSP
jgi:hypothetical protein